MWRICLTSIPIYYVYNLVMCCCFFNYLCLLSFSVYSFFEIMQETATPEIKSKSNKMGSNQVKKKKLQLKNWAINSTAQPCQWILVFTFWRSLVSTKKQRILNPYVKKKLSGFLHLVVLCTCVIFLKKIFCLDILEFSGELWWLVSSLHNNISKS